MFPAIAGMIMGQRKKSGACENSPRGPRTPRKWLRIRRNKLKRILREMSTAIIGTDHGAKEKAGAIRKQLQGLYNPP